MSALPLAPWAIAAIISGIVLLILIIVVPENVASLIGQAIQIVGRLVGALAAEADTGAKELFNILRGVLLGAGHSSTQSQAAPPAPSSPSAAAGGQAPGAGTPAGDKAPAGTKQSAAAENVDHDDPLIWIPETIFTRLLYLATVIVIAAADFVFAILRLQAVLFPSLPSPIGNLTLLSELTGALFVSIILLTGALTLDFLNVLPPPARLFPNLSDGKRRMLLIISVVSLLLSILVVGALFFEGQLLISQAQSVPILAILLATLLGVLEVLVVFLGAWGAIRGLAILLALAGGLIGLVLRLVALVLVQLSDALQVLATSIIPDLIFGIAAIFGHKRERPPHAVSPDANELAIVGYGDRGSLFTALLCEDVVKMYAGSGLAAVGAYAEEPSVRENVRTRLARQGVNDISPISAREGDPLVALKGQLIRSYQGHGGSNKILVWIVDAEKVTQCAGTLKSLKSDLPNVSITVVCLVPLGSNHHNEAYGQLKQLSSTKLAHGDTAVHTSVLVDHRSPLYRSLGEPNADKVVAESLSGMLLGPLHDPTNPSFVTVVRNINESGFAFAAISADTTGLVSQRAQSRAAAARSGGTSSSNPGGVAPELALTRTQEIVGKLFAGTDSATVSDHRPEQKQPGLFVSFVVPIPAKSPAFAQFKGSISNWLADKHDVYLYNVVEGDGTDLSDVKPNTQGDRYCQVGILYGISGIDATGN